MSTEQEFIEKLSDKLSFLNTDDRKEIIENYQQQFSEMRAEGLSDEKIIKSLEEIDVIVENVRKEFNVSKQSQYQSQFKQKYEGYKKNVNDFVHEKRSTDKEGKSYDVKKPLIKAWQLLITIIKVVVAICFVLILIGTLITIPLIIATFGLNITFTLFYVFILLFEISSYALTNRFLNYIGGIK